MKGCGGCHKIGVRDEASRQEARYGSPCDSCHTRHKFSKEEASRPEACRTCHMGFDHPQWEMWSGSKHGVIYHRITSYNVCYTKLLRGIGSPDIIDSSTLDLPSNTTPSTGTFSPGRTRSLSFFLTCSSGMSSSVPSSLILRAVFV